VPKIESDVESEAISMLKSISNYIPYSLEIKEASDLAMIVKNLYNLVSAYDENPTPNYSNVGYATGAIAYYMVQMSEGKGMFGFISVPDSPMSLTGPGNAPYKNHTKMINVFERSFDAETMAMVMLSNSKARDMNVTEGQDAFQIFFDQFLYSIGHEYVDTVQCMTYNNQTGAITDHIYNIDVAMMTNNETAMR